MSIVGKQIDMLMVDMSFCLPMNDITMVMNKCYFIGINQCCICQRLDSLEKNLITLPVVTFTRVEQQRFNQVAAELPPGGVLVFNSAFGRHIH